MYDFVPVADEIAEPQGSEARSWVADSEAAIIALRLSRDWSRRCPLPSSKAMLPVIMGTFEPAAIQGWIFFDEIYCMFFFILVFIDEALELVFRLMSIFIE